MEKFAGKLVGAVVGIILVVVGISKGINWIGSVVSKESSFISNLNVDWIMIGKIIVAVVCVILVLWLLPKLIKGFLKPFKKLEKDDLKSLASNRAAKWAVIATLCVVGIGLSIWFLEGWGVLLMLLVAIGIYIPFCFTIVKEGTAKMIMKLGQRYKPLIQWQGRTFDGEWNVIKETEERKEPYHPLGGLRWVGPWPFYTIYKFKFEWTGLDENGELEYHPPETIDFLSLKDFVYAFIVEKAEDRKGMPLDAFMVLTSAIVNPVKAWFNIDNWFRALITRIKPYVRDFLGTTIYSELTEQPKGLSELMDKKIWDRITSDEAEGGMPISKVFEEKYGIKMIRIETKDVNPPEKYREATLKKYLAEQDAKSRAIKTAGALITAIAQHTGVSIESIQDEFKTSPETALGKYKVLIPDCLDLIQRQMAIDGNAFFDLRYKGPKGMGAILSAIAAWQRMSRGGAGRKQDDTATDQQQKKSSNPRLEELEKLAKGVSSPHKEE